MIRKVNKSTLDEVKAISNQLYHLLYKSDECHSDEDFFEDECKHDKLLSKLWVLIAEMENQAVSHDRPRLTVKIKGTGKA